MRKDDRVRLRHMRDAAHKRCSELADDRMLVFASAKQRTRSLRQHVASYMGDEPRIAAKVIDERGNELMGVREPD